MRQLRWKVFILSAILVFEIAVMSLVPVIMYGALAFRVIAHLNREVGVGMIIIKIPALLCLIEGEHDLFIIP